MLGSISHERWEIFNEEVVVFFFICKQQQFNGPTSSTTMVKGDKAVIKCIPSKDADRKIIHDFNLLDISQFDWELYTSHVKFSDERKVGCVSAAMLVSSLLIR